MDRLKQSMTLMPNRNREAAWCKNYSCKSRKGSYKKALILDIFENSLSD